MRRLGYAQYVAQGGDWGAIVTDLMAVQAPMVPARPVDGARSGLSLFSTA